MKKTVSFAPMYDSPGPKHDASGAFQPMARKFAALHGGAVLLFDNNRELRRRAAEVAQHLSRQTADLDAVAFFCHGWRDGVQAGFRMADVKVLGDLLRGCTVTDAPIFLFACDTGRDGDADRKDDIDPASPALGLGGFAAALRDASQRTVYAHATPGHTTNNPYLIRLDAKGGAGQWVVAPGSEGWHQWRLDLVAGKWLTIAG